VGGHSSHLDENQMLVTWKCRQPVQRYAATMQGCLCDKAVVSNTQMQGTAEYFRETTIMLDGSSQKWDK
jgi:hypothetical protein